MNILVASNTQWSIKNFRKDLIINLSQLGHHVTTIGGKEEDFKDYHLNHELQNLQQYNFPLHKNKLEIFNDIITFFRLTLLVYNLKPQIVFSFTTKANIYLLIISNFLKFDAILTINGLGRLWENKASKLIISSLWRIFLRKGSKLVFQNNRDLRLYRRYLTKENKLLSIAYGSGYPSNSIQYTKPAIRDGRIQTIGYIGRSLKSKGLLEFIEAASIISKKYSKIKIIVVVKVIDGCADSINENELKYLCNKHHFELYINEDNVVDKLRNIDCVVLPTKYNEGCPRILIEAAANRTVLLTSKNAGCRSICIQAYNGFYISGYEPKSIAKDLDSIINLNQNEISRLKNNGIKLVESKFTVERINKHYTDLIK